MEDQFGLPGAGEVNVHFHLPILLFFFSQNYFFSPSGISIYPTLTLTQFLRAKSGTQVGSLHLMSEFGVTSLLWNGGIRMI